MKVQILYLLTQIIHMPVFYKIYKYGSPKVRSGGIIAGHDYFDYEAAFPYPGVRKAVDECFPTGIKVVTRTVWEFKK